MLHPRVLGIAAIAMMLVLPGAVAAHDGAHGYVYTETNAAGGNAVLAFARSAAGSLSAIGSFPTGGLGSGGGLATQGEVILTADHEWLLAVDAGSNDVALFRVRRDGTLALSDRAWAGGTTPVSLSASEDVVYVLDAGGAGNVAALRLDDASLSPIPGSSRPLSGSATNPAELAVSPDGRFVMVTERATNLIDTYTVGGDGRLGNAVVSASSGPVPYGFAFDERDVAIVSEAANSAVSSYRIGRSGAHVISASVPTEGLAACWVAVTPDGRWAFDTNAHGGTISSFAVAGSGAIALQASVAANTGAGSAPLDLAASPDGAFLYVNEAGAHGIGGYAIGSGGTLVAVPGFPALPAGASGLAVS